MMYEISREIFKQKLLDRTNTCLIQVVSGSSTEVPFKDIVTLEWTNTAAQDFSSKNPNKNMSYLFYGFDSDAINVKKTAEAIDSLGYPFIYFYQGSLALDKVLDKGIN